MYLFRPLMFCLSLKDCGSTPSLRSCTPWLPGTPWSTKNQFSSGNIVRHRVHIHTLKIVQCQLVSRGTNKKSIIVLYYTFLLCAIFRFTNKKRTLFLPYPFNFCLAFNKYVYRLTKTFSMFTIDLDQRLLILFYGPFLQNRWDHSKIKVF